MISDYGFAFLYIRYLHQRINNISGFIRDPSTSKKDGNTALFAIFIAVLMDYQGEIMPLIHPVSSLALSLALGIDNIKLVIRVKPYASVEKFFNVKAQFFVIVCRVFVVRMLSQIIFI